MTAVATVLVCFATYLLFYHFYAKWIARKVFRLDPNAVTPAHELEDGYDYVPSKKYTLFGHHYVSIAGLSPMLGPAIAIIWGWVPAMLWVVLGAVLFGAVHDFGALVMSMRNKGMSIGKSAESIIGPRAKSLFHAIIFFLIALAMGAFVMVVGQLFSAAFYPETVIPSVALMAVAMVIGVLFYKKGFPLARLTAAGLVVTFAAIYLGLALPKPDLSPDSWMSILLVYAFFSSLLPIWLMLQPRDFLNSLLLYLGLGSVFLGFIIMRPEFVAPALDTHPDGAPPLYPFVFIIIACGAISGFHALVSSGTTAKQIDKETDATFIGYGSMIGESLLGLSSVLACGVGFASAAAWQAHYSDWGQAQVLGNSMSAYINGSAMFLSQLGVPLDLGRSFIALMAVSFAMTTISSATRLLRYNIQEISETVRMPVLGNSYLSSLIAVAAIGFFAFFKVNGQPAGLALWALFGTTNQILGGLTLFALTLFLIQRRAKFFFVLIPMVFMLGTTLIAMVMNVKDFFMAENYLLLAIGSILLMLAVWLGVEGIIIFARGPSKVLARLKATEDGAGES
jgi:carbon starvation protein